jgi:retinol dehydrogenase 13
MTILITGANSGIGLAAAKQLATQGAELIVMCRSKEKGEATLQEIKQRTSQANVTYVIGDLASLASLKKAAEQITAQYDHLDVLINNAGGYFQEFSKTKDGFETTLGVNHLGSFYFTYLLLDLLKKSPQARIINTSSEAQRLGSIDLDKLMYTRENYDPWRAYAQSKLANILFTKSLAEKLHDTHISTYAVHPGVVKSNFGSDMSGLYKWMFALMKPFMISPEQGADTLVWLATEPSVGSDSGHFWSKRKKQSVHKQATIASFRRQFWEISEKLTGIRY